MASQCNVESGQLPNVRRLAGGGLVLEPTQAAIVAGTCRTEQAQLMPGTIHFGKYRGLTYTWLCEHDMGYVVSLIASHQRERVNNKSQSCLMENKDDLANFALQVPGVSVAVRERRRRDDLNRSPQEPVNLRGQTLLRFGKFSKRTWEDVYQNEKGYVKWIERESPSRGSPMASFKEFIERRRHSAQKVSSVLPSQVTPQPTVPVQRRMTPRAATSALLTLQSTHSHRRLAQPSPPRRVWSSQAVVSSPSASSTVTSPSASNTVSSPTAASTVSSPTAASGVASQRDAGRRGCDCAAGRRG
ncbi:uncharacterized protein [Branchiostoma lanceolatum]|uniref:uncharacterized protein n=1 Tax=Branchiostoma lanceolatum TaxID=7740 RepID=UPI00345199B9